MNTLVRNVAVVGAGVIGRSWVRVFARSGHPTRVFDKDAGQLSKAADWLDESLELDCKDGLLSPADVTRQRSQVSHVKDLREGLDGADYVQESGPERLEVKRAIYAELEQFAPPSAILASSTSAMDMTDIASGLATADRCIVAHPVNPPHVVPLVEVLPGRETRTDVVARTQEFLKSVGQTPVVMNAYIPGFLLNRMQAALIREAVNLVDKGIADAEGVDAVIREGLGLRWALMGPFGVANTNADGGVREYFARYRNAYLELMNDLGPTPSFSPEQIERLGRETDAMFRGTSLAAIRHWRDAMVRRICELKRKYPLS